MGWMKSSFIIIIIIETRVVHRAETTRDHSSSSSGLAGDARDGEGARRRTGMTDGLRIYGLFVSRSALASGTKSCEERRDVRDEIDGWRGEGASV